MASMFHSTTPEAVSARLLQELSTAISAGTDFFFPLFLSACLAISASAGTNMTASTPNLPASKHPGRSII